MPLAPTEHRRALIVVDPQVDFVSGSLAVPDAQAAMDVIGKLVKHYPLVAVTRDWHPANHSSFASNGGIWPDHCVAGTPGAWLADRSLEAFECFRKGENPGQEAYSGFQGSSWNGQSLAVWLSGNMAHLGLETVEIVGLALDYCVKATALDAASLGLNTMVNLHGVRGVKPDTSHAAIAEMASAGINVGTARMRYDGYLDALNRGILPAFK